MARVLVTRPEPGASETAARLEALGHQPLVLPLTEIRALPADAPDLSGFDAVAITSANAVRHAPEELLSRLSGLPAFAVGPRTAQRAREAGLHVMPEHRGDAAALARLVAEKVSRGSGIVVLCGRVRRDALEAGLSAAGLRSLVVETYDTLAKPLSEADVERLLGDASPDFVLVHSRFAASLLVQNASIGRRLTARFICISQRVAGALGRFPRETCLVAPAPTDEAMLSLIDDDLSR
ncbi:uroporphyrinogen-III synthase [Nitratireductor luteus]|uniref:uroporphyrinogen-III synthase n=1 Tax=Nitratireductor luteus TaxID=2976980 RepID=UPI00223FDC82